MEGSYEVGKFGRGGRRFLRPSPAPTWSGLVSGTPALSLVRPYRSLKFEFSAQLPKGSADKSAARPIPTNNLKMEIKIEK